MFFFGTFKHNLDDKSRCTIPTAFRDILGKVVYGTRGLDNCISIYPEETFISLCQKNASLDDFNETERQYKRVFAFSSSRYEIDKSGRITLTKDHLSRAAITKEVVIVGNYDHIEIWDRERFEEINKLQDDNFEKNAQSIALERRKTN